MKLFKLSLIILIPAFLTVIPTMGLGAGGVGISPAKIELSLAPGQEVRKEVTVINQTERSLVFNIETQDFVGGDSPTVATRILNNEDSPYSLRHFLFVNNGKSSFTLPAGGQISIPFLVSLPQDIVGGGYYGSILFSAKDLATSTINVSTRLGVLIFARVSGQNVDTKGEVREFGVRLGPDGSSPVFDVLFENQGDIYLNPYGYVRIRNWLGREAGFIEIKPQFVMPHSQRFLSAPSSLNLDPGWYHATLQLNRGYENVTDTKTVSLTIWSWWVIVLIVLLVFFAWWLIHRYLWKKD